MPSPGALRAWPPPQWRLERDPARFKQRPRRARSALGRRRQTFRPHRPPGGTVRQGNRV